MKSAVKRLVPRPLRPAVKRAVARLRTRPGRSSVVYRVQTHLSEPERLLLFGLVRGLRPARVLEIGTFHGASAAIIAAALEDNGAGTLVGVDPMNAVEYPKRFYFGRFTLVNAPSPDGLDRAREIAGGPFDFVHLDGINIYRQAAADLAACLPLLADRAFLLVNNPLHYGVDRAVREAVAAHDRLVDCGFLSTWGDPHVMPECAYSGLRLLRWGAIVDEAQPIVARAFDSAGLPVPTYDGVIDNHDIWYCREIRPCERSVPVGRTNYDGQGARQSG